MATNRFNVDVSYFENKMKLIIRDLDNYTPSELYRELTRLAVVAVSSRVLSKDETEARKRAILIDCNMWGID